MFPLEIIILKMALLILCSEFFVTQKPAFRGQLWKGKQNKFKGVIVKIVNCFNYAAVLKTLFWSLKQKVFEVE